MAQFQLSPCTPSDLDAMVEIYLRAFSKTYMYQMLFPISSCTTSSVRTWLYPRFKKVLTQGHAETKLFKITEAATGRVVAWSRWGYPFSLTDEEKARRGAETAREDKEREETEGATGKSGNWPEGANEGACREYFGAMDGMRGKYMKWDQDYICYLLATDPDFQRRGLGGILLGHVIALAEAECRRIYLEASPSGHPLYEKLGWKDVDLITIDLRKWGVDLSDCNWIMLREPQAKV